MAKYRVIADCYLDGGLYAFAGDLLSDQGEDGTLAIPVGWRPPTGAVDPISPDAVTAYFAEGPRGMNNSQANQPIFPWGWSRFSGGAYVPAFYYWRRVGENEFVLNRAESLGVKSDYGTP